MLLQYPYLEAEAYVTVQIASSFWFLWWLFAQKVYLKEVGMFVTLELMLNAVFLWGSKHLVYILFLKLF